MKEKSKLAFVKITAFNAVFILLTRIIVSIK